MKSFLGAVSLWPPEYPLLFFGVNASIVSQMGTVFHVGDHGSTSPPDHPPCEGTHDLLHGECVSKRPRQQGHESLVGGRYVMGAMVAMPINWYLYIWRDVAPSTDLNRIGAAGPRPLTRAGSTLTVGSNVDYVLPSQPPNWR